MEAKFQPRIVRGRIELWVPHQGKEVAFAYPSFGPNTYQEVGSQILKSDQSLPTGDLTASLLHAAYCDPRVSAEPEFQDIQGKMKSNWLWAYNRNL